VEKAPSDEGLSVIHAEFGFAVCEAFEQCALRDVIFAL
jgi:hypothetical protein